MPTKPWTLAPKKSLNLFGGLGAVLDQRAERQATLEDRLASQGRQQKEDELLDLRIQQARAPEVAKIIGRETDPTTGDVFNIMSDGTAQPVRLSGTPRTSAPSFEGHAGDDTFHGQAAPQQTPQSPAQSLRMGVKKPEPKAKRTQLVKNDKGVMVSVDMETGLDTSGKPVRAWQEPDKPEKTGFDALPPAQQNQVKLQQSSILNLQSAIQRLDDAVAKHGLEVMPGKGRAAMDALMKEAQIQYKEAANLGVLNGPDLTLIEQALGNATSPTQFLRGGADGVRAALSSAQEALRSRVKNLERVYGVAMPAATEVAPSQPTAARPPSPARPGTGPMPTLNPDVWLAKVRGGTPR